MTTQELFHPAAMPKELFVTLNLSIVEIEGVKPKTFGWKDTRVIHSPDELMIPGWLESTWNVGDTVECICPAEIDGDRRRKENNPKVSLLGLDFDSENAPKLEDLKQDLKAFAGFWYTTKSHQKIKNGVVCDRYRCFLAYSRPVSHEENHRIHNLLSHELGHDAQCGDGTRLFYPSVVGCQYDTFGGSAAVDVESLLSIAPPETRQNGPTTRASASKGNTGPKGKPLAIGLKAANSAHIKVLSEVWQNLKDENTCTKHFKLCLWWFGSYSLDKEALKAALPKVQAIKGYYDAHPNQWTGIDATIEKAFSEVLADRRNNLRSVNPVEIVDTDQMTIFENAQDAAILASKVKGCNPQSMFDEAVLIDHVLRTQKRGIIDISCGGGKSLVTSAFVASDKSEKWIIVKDTKDACRKQADLLKRYGEDDVQIVYGWDKDECRNHIERFMATYPQKFYKQGQFEDMTKALEETEKGWKAFYGNESPCKKCLVAECVFKHARKHNKVASSILNNRITIMTHSRYLSLFKWFKSDRAHNIRVLIDEEPSCFQTVCFEPSETKFLMEAFKNCLSNKVVFHIQGVLNNHASEVFLDPVFFSRKDKKSLQKRASKFNDAERDLCYRYIEFFSYPCERYAMAEVDSGTAQNGLKKLSFARNRLSLDYPNPVYVLSASAKFGMVAWDGFKVYRPAKQKDASGVTVWAYPANSTKRRMDKEAMDFLKYTFGVVKTNKRKRVLLALNKEDNQSQAVRDAVTWFKAECQKLGIEVREGNRGSIIGRNDWRDCDCVVMGYGLFTSVSNVALKTSLYEGKPVEGGRAKDSKGVPLLKKGMSDSGLRDIDKRLFCDEVYQVGLRGVARNWNGASMDIVTTAPSMDYVLPLRQVLAGARIVFDTLDFDSLNREELQKSPSVLAKRFGFKNKDKETLNKAFDLGKDILAYCNAV